MCNRVAGWVVRTLRHHVDKVVVRDPQRNKSITQASPVSHARLIHRQEPVPDNWSDHRNEPVLLTRTIGSPYEGCTIESLKWIIDLMAGLG